MKYIIWGTGVYCSEKIDSFNENDILAFVDRKRGIFRGRQIILPTEIETYTYDYIVVLSGHYAEIIQEMVQLGIAYSKIIPGINCKPYLINELEYISAKSRVVVTPEGGLEYLYNGNVYTKIDNKEDWEEIRKLICSEKNSDIIKKMDVNPVGKTYGAFRGGSICRYYLDGFLNQYKSAITGDVLEIGDRNYTDRYGTDVKASYVLHFDGQFERYGLDFKGDLRTGEGINTNSYDCIILTQVLNFVQNINQTPDILINALKTGGKLLISVSGISPIARYDMDKYGHYWNFTDKSISNMFTRDNTKCEVWTKGNCKVACAFLQGMGCSELTMEELEYTDEDFQVVILAVVTKIG